MIFVLRLLILCNVTKEHNCASEDQPIRSPLAHLMRVRSTVWICACTTRVRAFLGCYNFPCISVKNESVSRHEILRQICPFAIYVVIFKNKGSKGFILYWLFNGNSPSSQSSRALLRHCVTWPHGSTMEHRPPSTTKDPSWSRVWRQCKILYATDLVQQEMGSYRAWLIKSKCPSSTNSVVSQWN